MPSARPVRSRGPSRAPSRGRPARAAPSAGEPRFRGLHEYGLIGNLHTAALVSRAGSVDWACLPRFASASTFGRLLDPTVGGSFTIRPTGRWRSTQAYLPSTAVLETRFDVGRSRTLTLMDFMPLFPPPAGEQAPMLVRVLEAVGGPVPVEAIVEPRFEYGRFPATWREAGLRWIGRSPVGTVTCLPGWTMEVQGGRLVGRCTLPPGERTAFEAYWGTDRPTRESAHDLLHRTEEFWRGWAHGPQSPIHRLAGEWHAWIERSELTLKLLSNAESGAFVAAPTTSLPEWIGGSRNWDYRYVWVRDAAFAAQSLLLMGHVEEATSFLRWMFKLQRGPARNRRLRVIYAAHGEDDLAERELPHLAGYRDSRPVRVGNDAVNQFQLDIYGELLDAAQLLYEIAPDALTGWWPSIEPLVEDVTRSWRRPDRGIWEVRSAPAHYVHSKVMAWVALDRAARIGKEFAGAGRSARWEREAASVRTAVLTRGYDVRRATFTQFFGSTLVDAANLRLPLVGFLPAEDERIVNTIRAVQTDLTRGPFVYRYRGDDGIEGEEGAFLPCSFWLVDCLARLGEGRKARRDFAALLRAASPLALFSEEYDPVAQQALGNYPQAFTHIALIRAALTLGADVAPRTFASERPARATDG